MMGIGASNLYYPAGSRCLRTMLGRLNTSFSGGVMGNLMSEFWLRICKRNSSTTSKPSEDWELAVLQ